MASNTNLGQFIRSCRGSLRFSGQKVEELSLSKPHYERISPANLVDIEYGRHVPSFGKMLTLAEILDVPLHHFEERYRMDREGNETAPKQATYSELYSQAWELMKAGRYRKALIRFKQARQLAPRDNPVEKKEIEIQISNCRKRFGMMRVAREDLERILASEDINEDQRVRATAYLANVYCNLQNHFMARLLLREAITLARKQDLIDILARLYVYLGNVYTMKSDPRSAVREYRKALTEHKRRKDRLSVAITLGNIANCRMQAGRFDEAESLCRESLKIVSELSNLRGIATAHCNLTELYFKTAQFQMAKTHAVRALNIAREEDYYDILCQTSYFQWEMARRNGNKVQEKMLYNTLRKYTKKLEFKLPTLKVFYDYLEKREFRGVN
ncbi:tetratricopeptide repeat protein [Acidobacteriota bacterium]